MIHKHHVIPRHEWKVRFGNLKGFNAPDNIVYLTIEQHSQAHQFLFELNHKHDDFVAWKVLSGQMTIPDGRELMRRQRIKEYQNRSEVKKAMSQRMIGNTPWNKGITTNTDHLRKFTKGCIPWNKGIPMSDEAKEKCRQTTINMNNSGRFQPGHKPYHINCTPEIRERIRMSALKREAAKRLTMKQGEV